MTDIETAHELARIGRGLEGPDRAAVMAAADEIARLSAEVARLKSALASAPSTRPSPMDEADRKALQQYRSIHRYDNPEHPG
jgi:hypothetical protein